MTPEQVKSLRFYFENMLNLANGGLLSIQTMCTHPRMTSEIQFMPTGHEVEYRCPDCGYQHIGN